MSNLNSTDGNQPGPSGSTFERYDELIGTLRDAVDERVRAETQARETFPAGYQPSDEPLERALADLAARQEQHLAELASRHEARQGEIRRRFDTEYQSVQSEYDQTLRSIDREYTSSEKAALQDSKDSEWILASVLDTAEEANALRKFEQFRDQLTHTREEQQRNWAELEREFAGTVELISSRRLSCDVDPPQTPKKSDDRERLNEWFVDAYSTAMREMDAIRKQSLGRLFTGLRPLWFLLIVLAAVVAGGFFAVSPSWVGLSFQPTDPIWLAILAGAGVVVYGVFYGILWSTASRKASDAFEVVQQQVLIAKTSHERWMSLSKKALAQRKEEAQRAHATMDDQKRKSLQTLQKRRAKLKSEAEQKRDAAMREAQATYPPRLEEIRAERDRELEADRQEYEGVVAEAERRFTEEREQIDAQHRNFLDNQIRQYETLYKQLSTRWDSAMAELARTSDRLQQDSRDRCPPWSELAESGWEPPMMLPDGIRVGQYEVDLAALEHGLSDDPKLHPPRTKFTFPACLPFPNHPSLLLKSDGRGRAAAVDMLRVAMLRLLTQIPPGKIRFTILDPIGLGENFSAFMHLADFDEVLISSRIWTEASHIEQQLVNLTEHMENVFQKYLRNEFRTIEEYNDQAGEVAEPYHILVVANFPANFNEDSARRLSSIVSSGARCGIYTLMSVDTRQKMPHNFELSDLEPHMTTLVWKNDGFSGPTETLAKTSLVADPVPSPEEFAQIVKNVGRLSQNARRVEVPFSRIAPRRDRLWQLDSRSGIDVPLGRAGAMKLQSMRLGRGTSQHVLVAGKTGSGKSTFLHALITNVALHYSPDEVEFFLIDFKKGVEFKTYVTNRLPHARVIAIESDREFGVSALERLNGILSERGERFREAGVQDVAAFRNAHPEEAMPRIMLIIDEFQEFFVEDDKISQSAALLLDRLVRQGRAFGIHVLLGSQTLGGAYSLARSTLGQMAVRIALQCSESDAHLILSEDNTAARLLSRPGEAIYNDANGTIEGNHPFQIAWLDEPQRESYLDAVHEQQERRGVRTAPPIVFEGNVASDVSRNHALETLLDEYGPSAHVTEGAPRIWVGESVSIKDPTSIVFPRHAGTNVILAGQSESSVQGIVAAGLISLAAQIPAPESGDAPPTFYLLDGDLHSKGHEDLWTGLAETLPQGLDFADQPRAGELVARVAEEVKRREENGDADAPPLFLFIVNLSKFRDLRKGEDDFGFTSSLDAEEKPPEPDKQLSEVIKNGPVVGVHVVAWCDTYKNADRWLGRNLLREFGHRIVFQMNPMDSSNLIDSPAAGRLGSHRALYYRDDEGTVEKFRPYGVPSSEWLGTVKERMTSRSGLETASSVDVDDLDSWTIT